jgi:glycosyltransferase involved in cell wall biosynthesis
MSVSVVVETITAREDSKGALADDLRGALEALAKQTVAPDEVIIVLDDDVERSAADEVRRRYPYAKFAASKQSNYFDAKNAGAAIATGEFVALLDSDCQPAPDWLELLLARFTSGVDGVAGYTRYVGRSLIARTLSVPDFAHVVEQETGTASGMNLNNVAFRREVFLRHPLDARIRRNGGCYFLFNQLRAAGGRVVYEPRARTFHGYAGGLTLLRKHFDRGYDGVGVYRLDEQCVLRGTRLFRRLGPIALVGITGRRVVMDWIRMARKRREIGISALALPYFCAVVVGTRMLELAGGFVAIASPRRYTRRVA